MGLHVYGLKILSNYTFIDKGYDMKSAAKEIVWAKFL